jgi:multidrug efflux system outer membrane protein
MTSRPLTWLAAITAVAPLGLGGCATGPASVLPATTAAAPVQWAAPLPHEAAWPHEGRLDHLRHWWQQQGDPVLAAFIEAAQVASPSISSAAARRAQAQAERTAVGAAGAPQLEATGSAQRRSATPPFPAGEVAQAAVQLSWELDVFGGLRSQRQAAQWRLQSADAAWHEARVSLAADVALQVQSWRHCQAVLKVLQQDADTAGRSAQLMRRMADAGLQPAEQAGLADMAAAEARNRSRAQAQRCDADVKALVQYSAWPEARVRAQLSAPHPAQALRHTPALPAATLAQRPDVFMAAAAVAAAAADLGAQQAQRYPRVGLSGSIGRLNSQSAAGSFTLETWSVGPLSVSLPVFDAGRRAAQVEAARARYDDARVQHQATVRRAVREVEEALLGLDSTAQQERDAQLALQQAQAALKAVELRERGGLASALQVDEARRRALGAQASWLDLQRARQAAWVGLYRAAGGGWTVPQDITTRAAGEPAN